MYHSEEKDGGQCQPARYDSSGDKRYEFVTQHIAPGTEIRTKGQWERFKKQQGLVDMSPKEQMAWTVGGGAEKRAEERRTELRRELASTFDRTLQRMGNNTAQKLSRELLTKAGRLR